MFLHNGSFPMFFLIITKQIEDSSSKIYIPMGFKFCATKNTLSNAFVKVLTKYLERVLFNLHSIFSIILL